MKNSLYKCWEVRQDGVYAPSYTTTKRLPAGVYEIRFIQNIGYHLKLQDVVTEDIVKIPMPEIQSVLLDITTFWQKGDVYKKNKLVFKRGVLLFGRPGTGKSYVVQSLIKEVIEEMDGIVISLVSAQCVENYIGFASQILRVIEPERKMIIVIEDMEEIIYRGHYDTPGQLLNMLDGLKQVDGGTVYIATTNHPEKIESHFKRPGRFDIRRRIGLPNEDARLHFFKHKLSEEEQKKYDIKKWAAETTNLTISQLKELIIAVIIMNKNYEKALNTLKLSSDLDALRDDESKIGF